MKKKLKWANYDDIQKLDTSEYSEFFLNDLSNYLETLNIELKNKGLSRSINSLKNFKALKDNPTGYVVTSLPEFAVQLKALISKTKNHWLFYFNENNFLVPALVTNITYVPAVKKKDYYEEAFVYLTYRYISKGQSTTGTTTFRSTVLKKEIGKTLFENGLFCETEENYKEYEIEMNRWNNMRSLIGHQLSGFGISSSINSNGWYIKENKTSLLTDGIPTKLIIDEYPTKDGINYTYTDSCFSENKLDEITDELIHTIVDIPVHPYLYCFNLKNHQSIWVHTSGVEEYKYDKTVKDKLILPSTTREMIDILIESGGETIEDIIIGKSGGIIIMASGYPGTGKTLTAEAYSEIIEKPLYMVQSSQLGLSVGKLEENLKGILDKAGKWNCILLIDECDVYVRARENDIEQNAIVGVFLRVLEYYRGILFMTTNRATSIDDAILSRCTAHIKYDKPTLIERISIWYTLMKQFNIEFSEDLPTILGNKYEDITGRDIKNILKLSKLICKKRNQQIDVNIVDFAIQYQDITK